MKSFKQIAELVIVGVLILLACRKEEQPDINAAADPCACASEVSADFTMEEVSVWQSEYAFETETDSIIGNSYVRFKAKEKDAEYLWYLGTETESTKDTYRKFDASLVGTTQSVILVVKKEPNKLCFPEDDGYDSLVKYVKVTNYPINDWNNGQVYFGTKEGVFRMRGQNSTDSVDIIIDYAVDEFNNFVLNLYNFDGNGTDCFESIDDYSLTYRETRFFYTSVVSCNRLRGYIKTPVNGPVEMYFTQQDPGDPDYQVYHYFGRRLGLN